MTLGLLAATAADREASIAAPAESPGVRPGPARDPRLRRAAIFAMLGIVPDVDLLFGVHSTYTHSIGAVAIVFVCAWLILARGWLAGAAALAYGSHILLDWLGHDSTAPIGITALWPFSAAYYESALHLFMPISRRYWLLSAWHHNLIAVARELLLLLPCAALAWWFAAPRRARGNSP